MKGKAKRMAINKEAKNKSTIAGERIMIDISSVKSEEEMKRVGKFWLLVIYEATDMKWSFFLRSKGAQVPLLVIFLKELKEQNKTTKFIRCDNAVENLSLKKKCDVMKKE